jgi:hypothetical protein
MFPQHTDLNYIYLLTIISGYYGLSQKPFKGRYFYDGIRNYILMLIVPLLGMWYYNCTNEIRMLEQQ